MTDQRMERMISVLLRAGVLVSGAVVLAGGILLLLREGGDQVHFRNFRAEPISNRATASIVAGAMRGRAQSIIQLGVLLLIVTPVARVALSLAGFALERDRHYVLVTAIVLAVLAYSLSHSVAG